ISGRQFSELTIAAGQAIVCGIVAPHLKRSLCYVSTTFMLTIVYSFAVFALAGCDDVLRAIGYDLYGGNVALTIGTYRPALSALVLKLLKTPGAITVYIVDLHGTSPDTVEPDFVFAQSRFKCPCRRSRFESDGRPIVTCRKLLFINGALFVAIGHPV